MSKNSIIPFLKDYLINFLTRPFLLDTNEIKYKYGIIRLFFYRALLQYIKKTPKMQANKKTDISNYPISVSFHMLQAFIIY